MFEKLHFEFFIVEIPLKKFFTSVHVPIIVIKIFLYPSSLFFNCFFTRRKPYFSLRTVNPNYNGIEYPLIVLGGGGTLNKVFVFTYPFVKKIFELKFWVFIKRCFSY